MLPIAYYLFKVIVCSGILYAYYWLLLRNKVFHKYNRFYLMFSVVLSLLLPLIKINFWQQDAQPQASVIKVLQAVSQSDEYMDTIIVTANNTTTNTTFDATQLYPFAYLLVSLILLAVFLHTLFVIFSLLKKYPKQTINKISFINTDAKSTPFSFLNYIFWNQHIDMETTTGNQIFKHELAHVEEKHTHDKLFINIILIFFWCNPFYWLYRKELNMIHEFIADKKAVEDSDTEAFAAMILKATYPQHRFQLTNNFFYSPIKRRLLMLTKNKNPKVNYIGRIMALPLLILIFAAFTLKTKQQTILNKYNGKKIVVVIDAGHGGNDIGAAFQSYTNGIKNKDIFEKDIVLEIAKKVKALSNNDAIEIILTRDDDTYTNPKEKAAFAKAAGADLLISIHVDGTSKPNQKTGLSVWVARNEFENTKASKVLAAIVIDEFSKNYPLQVAPNAKQREKGILILQANNIPAVIIETGFMTNDKDVTYLKTEAAKETIAKNILAAIDKFATTNLQNTSSVNHILDTPIFKNNIYINTKYADTNYFKTDAFKNKALVIIDGKEIGYLGMNYVEKSNTNYNSIVPYNPEQAKKVYGKKGSYGVIKLTIKDIATITADSIFFDEKSNLVKLSGSNTTIEGNFANTLIYIDGKIATPTELKAVSPVKISSVNIIKGSKLDDILDAKGKTTVINVSLKPDDLKGGVVVGRKKTVPLYVIDGEQKNQDFNINSISPNDIDKIDVLKDKVATDKYGEKGGNGVLEITTKKNQSIVTKITNPPQFGIDEMRTVRMSTAKLKASKILTAGNGYQVASATVYFSGAGFPKVVVVNLIGNELNKLSEFVNKCENGTTMTFDNIRLKGDKNYYASIDGLSVALYEENNTDNKIFTKTGVEPSFTGGNDAWRAYLQKNLNADIPVKEGWKPGTYTIVVQFIVHTDGSVSNVTAINNQGSKTAQHCIDLIEKSSKWVPAVQNGKTVTAYRKQHITFVIEGDKKLTTEVYSVPLKVHLLNDGKISTYNMVGNGSFTKQPNKLFYINGKLTSNSGSIKKENVTKMETYDAGSGKFFFGEKGKYGVTLITTKS